MKLNFLTILFLFCTFFFFQGCTKKYYYQEDTKPEVLIEAANDKEAYIVAYRKFKISEKVMTESKKTFSYTNVPISFKLYNSKHEDITYSVHFEGKDSIERAFDNSISKHEISIYKSISSGSNIDTSGLYLSPVKIISSKFIEKEYSSYRDIKLTYKNVSKKRITGIKFRWYGVTAFNEPADMGGSINGGGGGFDDDVLNIGITTSSTWTINSSNGKKITLAYPYEVAFEDGTNWTLNE